MYPFSVFFLLVRPPTPSLSFCLSASGWVAENPELSQLLAFKPELGQITALHVSSSARNVSFLISTFLVRLASAVQPTSSADIK